MTQIEYNLTFNHEQVRQIFIVKYLNCKLSAGDRTDARMHDEDLQR